MITNLEIVIRLLLGAILGGAIGFERHLHGRPAGFRTHLLVCVASVLLMTVSEYYHHLSVINSSYVRIDPARLAAGAITGMGFLGAGVIIKSGATVHGLTTAACLWIVSAIGLAVGSGLYVAAGASFFITFLVLWILRKVETRVPRQEFKFMTVVVKKDTDEEVLMAAVTRHGTAISNVNYDFDLVKEESTYNLTIALKNRKFLRKTLGEVAALPFVKRVAVRS